MPELEAVFLDTVDEVIKNVFDDETAKIILGYLKKNSSRNMDDRVRMFAESLPKLLGVGSVIIEDLILETLYSKMGLESEPRKGCGFWESVAELRNRTVRSEC